MRAHRDQVTALGLNPFEDFLYRFAISKFGGSRNAGSLKFRLYSIEIFSAVIHFFARGVRAVNFCRSTGRDVQQEDSATHDACKRLDMFDDWSVGLRGIKGQKN